MCRYYCMRIAVTRPAAKRLSIHSSDVIISSHMAQHLNTCSKVVHVAGGELDTGHLSLNTCALTGVGEIHLHSLDEHMNHEINTRVSTRIKDAPIEAMYAIGNFIAHDVILPSKLQTPLTEASIPMYPLQTYCTSTSHPLTCCFRC
jgi:hypothetical protein